MDTLSTILIASCLNTTAPADSACSPEPDFSLNGICIIDTLLGIHVSAIMSIPQELLTLGLNSDPPGLDIRRCFQRNSP